MSKKGVKGGSVSDSYKILTAQQLSITKLECFINAAQALIGTKTQVDLLCDLFEACRETVRELDQCTLDLHTIRHAQERPNTPIPQAIKGKVQ